MAYLWSSQAQINYYLNQHSDISIGDGTTDNYASAAAQEQENLAVYEIESALAVGYEVPFATDNTPLGQLAAKLAAAFIGTSRLGSDYGQEAAVWTDRYKMEVYTRLANMLQTHQDLSGITKRPASSWKRRMAVKAILERNPSVPIP